MSKQRYKVICIKDVQFKVNNKILFKTGESYECCIRDKNTIEVLFEQDKKSGWLFYNNTSILSYKQFSEHFVSLGEWREQQINSILDD
jgi:hypothetical protein